jgi:amidase
MARTVLDTARLLQAIAGYDQIDDRQLGAPLPGVVPYVDNLLASRSQGVKGLKIGVLVEGFADKNMDSEVVKVVRAAISRFETMGAVVQEVSVPT